MRKTAVIRDVSEIALLVSYPELSDAQANRQAVRLARRLALRKDAGLLDAIPGARTLLVLFDPRQFDRRRLAREAAAARPRDDAPEAARRLLRIPVHYGNDSGPDLPGLASQRGLSPEEFAQRHAAAEHAVAFIGFSPGFPYLEGLPAQLHVPRLATPRARVPAGSVAIAGRYSGIYPSATPGGWRLIGRTATRLFDPEADPPALLAAGDRVLFEPVAREELARALAHPSRRRSREPARPLLRVLSPGLATSVQGSPRFGLGSSGVPSGGAMDPVSLAQGNSLVGNPPRAAALEVTLVGPRLEFLAPARIAVAGAELDGRHNGRALVCGQAVSVHAGDVVDVGTARAGARAYLCLEGGIAPPFCPDGVSPFLSAEDLLEAAREAGGESLEPGAGSPRLAPPGEELLLRLLPGPQEEHLSPAGLETFFGAAYRVSASSDRRGVRLEGPPVELDRSPDIPPEGTAPGAIQIPGDGRPIVLGPDRPITGGYAKPATVIAADLPLLAQARPGTRVRFRAVTLQDARQAMRSSMAWP